jgi:membrane-bound ClpP family serine protease
MFIAIAILLLGLIGVLPLQYALPLALASLLFGGLTFWSMQRKLARIPHENGQDAMLGCRVPALTNIGRDGQIRWGNEIWSARSDFGPIAPGQWVRIVRVSGLRAIVEPDRSESGR